MKKRKEGDTNEDRRGGKGQLDNCPLRIGVKGNFIGAQG